VTRRGALELTAGVVGLAVAVVILFAMADVRRWQRALVRGDARFQVMHAASSEFGETTVPPVARWKGPHGAVAAATKDLIGLGDDLEFRRALAVYRSANPNPNEQAQFGSDPELPARRIRAQQALTAVSKTAPDSRTRSRATNMLGILAKTGPTPNDPAEERNQILTAIGLFRSAIKLDPGNADAKFNLELLLQDPQTQGFVGTSPNGNPDAGKRGGSGSEGQGY
jgi:hypothetical protein